MSDRTARARIRDAAISRFATEGFAAANIKDIAADAGVSPALVIHHFDSKDALRSSCDSHVAALIRKQKTEAMKRGPSMDPLESMRELGDDPPVMRYLARTLSAGSQALDELVNQMVDDAVEYMQTGIDVGVVKSTEHLRDVATVLTLWGLGSLILHDHARRLIGTDLISGDPGARRRWTTAALHILTDGVLTADVVERMFDV